MLPHMKNSKISVIIPTYNKAKTLSRAITSVFEQEYDNIEIIVVDDASTDNTSDVCSNMADSRIFYLRRIRNGGVSAARNDGIRAATGEYIAFLDSDDAWTSNKIRDQLKVFEMHKTVGMVFVNAYVVTGKNKKLFIDRSKCSRIVYGSKERCVGIFPGAIMVTPPSSWMFKKSVIDETGFFDEMMRVWEDCDYFVRIAKKYDVYFLNVPSMLRYVEDDNQISRNMFTWHEGRKVFYSKHIWLMKDDKDYIFKFYKGMGKDCLVLKDRNNATRWFIKAIRINPFAFNLYGRLIRLAVSNYIKH